MTKKMMLLALAALSAALFALPAVASAQEIHLEPGNQAFNIAGGEGSLSAEGEPKITCQATDGEGVQTNSTTGEMTLDFTGCHINVIGFTVKCRSVGSALDNTIATGGEYHLITWKNSSNEPFPAILVTADPTEVKCGSIATVYVTGAVIGTITSPKCNTESTTLGLSFTQTSGTQDHEVYTGETYDLQASTNSDHSEPVTAALQTSATATTPSPSFLNCT